MPNFGNFGPLGAAEDIKIFFQIFLFSSTHTIRQLFFAIKFPNSEIKFFAYTFTAAYWLFQNSGWQLSSLVCSELDSGSVRFLPGLCGPVQSLFGLCGPARFLPGLCGPLRFLPGLGSIVSESHVLVSVKSRYYGLSVSAVRNDMKWT